MGLFDWLKKTLGGSPQPPARPSPSPAQRTPAPAPQPSQPPAPARPSFVAPSPTPRQQPTPAARPTPADLSHLDLAQFAPLSSAEAHAKAGSVGTLWGNPWFGRRDLIPPVDDPRTILIDRAMVGQGLLTPEELVEIHAVGREMDQIRPDLALAQTMASAAVRALKEEKQALKQQKRQEAAARREQQAAEVIARRKTDIVFLGRSVSKGLADRRSHLERLKQLGLPVLSTPADVANALGLTIPRLRWLAFHNEAARRTHYVHFTVPKRSGGERKLSAPHKSLRACQDWILENVLAKIETHPAAHGFVPGHSTLTNASPHVGRETVVNCDLQDFFPSVAIGRVKWVFRSLGYSPAVATIFALLCTEAPRQTVQLNGTTYHVATGPRGLPQGAPTSPALSNLAARRMDKRLSGVAAKLGWTYTRYADDLTFSASGEPTAKVGYLLARIRHIAQDERFAVNEKKTRIQRRNSRQSVTGVVVNVRAGAPRPLVRRLRAILHQAKKQGLKSQNRENLSHFESWLEGMIAYIEMLNPEQGRRLRSAWQELFPVP